MPVKYCHGELKWPAPRTTLLDEVVVMMMVVAVMEHRCDFVLEHPQPRHPLLQDFLPTSPPH
jgi:hypothetical protein